MIILLLNSHLWEMTDAKYYLYSATLFIYCPILSTGCNNYYNYYYETIYSLCIPLPKSFTSVIYLIYQQINCDFTIIYHLFIEMVFYFYLSECLRPQFRSGLWFTGLCSFLTHITLHQDDFSVFSESWMRFMPSSMYPNKWTIELQNRTVYK